MQKEFNRHGRRLTGEEYDRKTVGLFQMMPNGLTGGTKAEDVEYRKAQLNLEIDHRLGVDFPADRREQMWKAAEEADRGRIAQAFKIVARHVWNGFKGPLDGNREDASILAQMVVNKYGKVLDAEELEQFLPKADRKEFIENSWKPPKPRQRGP